MRQDAHPKAPDSAQSGSWKDRGLLWSQRLYRLGRSPSLPREGYETVRGLRKGAGYNRPAAARIDHQNIMETVIIEVETSDTQNGSHALA